MGNKEDSLVYVGFGWERKIAYAIDVLLGERFEVFLERKNWGKYSSYYLGIEAKIAVAANV